MGRSGVGQRTAKRRLVVVLILALSALALGAPGVEAASTGQCDDGRPWTSERVGADGTCTFGNLCSDVSIDLSFDTNLFWNWNFPDQCPVAALDALGVSVRRHVPTAEGTTVGDDTDPAGLEAGSTVIVEDHSVASPGKQGQGSVPVTCGLITLDFTIVADNEMVASGQGQVDTGDCPNPRPRTEPAPLLREWAGTSGRTGELARLYWTAFARPPDSDGFNYWMALTTGGLDVRDAMTTWTSLPEWQLIYGQTNDAVFLERTYQNVLGRTPENGGNAYWLGQLEAGLDRGELVLLFADSAELRQRTLTG